MSEKMSHNSQSSVSIEKLKAKQEAVLVEEQAARAEQELKLIEDQEEALLYEIFEDSLTGNSVEDKKRLEEGTKYYKHLENMLISEIESKKKIQQNPREEYKYNLTCVDDFRKIKAQNESQKESNDNREVSDEINDNDTEILKSEAPVVDTEDEKLELVGSIANVIEAIRVKKSEEREADITDYVVALHQIAIDLRNLRTKAARNSSPGVELQIDLQEKAFERAYDSLEDFYGDEDPRVLESLLNLAYDPPGSVENIEPKPENTKDSDELIQQDPKLRKLAIDLSTMPLYNWTVEQHPLREGLTEDISEKSSEAIADESDVVAPIVEADASSAETTEAQSKSEVENINDRIENVINDEYRETLGKLRELAHELYEAWRTSDPSYNDKLDYFNQKTSQIEDMFNLGYIEGDIESKEKLADIKKAINRIKTEAGFDGLGTLRGLLRHLQNDKFKDRHGYDFARDNYLSERKNIINSLNNLNKKDPEVAAERKYIRNVLKELDNEFKSVEPYIRDENKITDKVKNKVKGAFETSPNVIATNELKNNLKDRFKGFVNTIGSGLKDFANYTPSERLAGETNRDYRARLSSESNSKFMSMAAIAKTIVPRR